MPLPYMGSKRKLAKDIYQAISSKNNTGIFVDPFCGGFAVSEEFLKHGWEVYSSDINKYIIALLRAVLFGDDWLNKQLAKPDFITREKFFDIIRNPDKYDDCVVGFVQCVWSFGNKGTTYLYGKPVEDIKHIAHNYVINGDEKQFKEMLKVENISLPNELFPKMAEMPLSDWFTRRRLLQGTARKLYRKYRELEHLQRMGQLTNMRLEHLERMGLLRQMQNLERMYYLARMQHLERLSDLKNMQGNNIKQLETKQYKDVVIPKGAVVYCDPPYANTAKYVTGEFNSDEFWAWADEVSRTNPVYVSEYTAPDLAGWKSVLNIDKRVTLSKDNNSKNATEHLFYKFGGE